ncbi:MAG: enoyl-CoA hydratase/isomerase family protein [Gammaproteobacteria bacterium]|nr:enoyl-CoA hydratase/isomerase family protein [Gammaproteobacteria bacterium]
MFKKIVVIGAGTMGSGIAGQIANAGHRVLLLDLPGEQGRNDVTERALQRLISSDPPALHHKRMVENIAIGNTEDDFAELASADWVVEAVVERLDIKKALYQRLHEVTCAQCVVTSNTSTIPIAVLVEGMPLEFQRRFAITHYFNPVRYMRLLELVRGENTDPHIIDKLADFNDRELGKGVVRCADTPGFLGNRVGVFALQVGIDEAIRNKLAIETADALMGRPMGIPKTGVFGLYDLIGIDLMADVVRSLRSILPDGDAFHEVGAENDMINSMISAGLTGEKGGGGFYKDEDGVRLARDLGSGDYSTAAEELPVRAQMAAIALAEQNEPLTGLIEGNDAEALFSRNVLGRVLGYAASLLGEVTESPQAIDDAMKLGFNWIRGPFEMIDAIGADKVAAMLAATGRDVPAALKNTHPFYSVSNRQLSIRLADGQVAPIALPEGVVRFHLTRRTLTPLDSNVAASLYEIENDCRLIEFHSKANALTDDSMRIVASAVQNPGRGIIVHNDAQHYSAGVDLNAFLALIDAEDWSGIDEFLARFQSAVKALKYTDVPVVGAPSGLSLGGGFEVLMHCDELVVHSNSVLGLVESAVGLVPGGGGVKETYLRWYQTQGDWDQAAWQTWMNIGYGATASSPEQALKLGYFRESVDHSVMNRDRLYTQAVQLIDTLATGYQPPSEPKIILAGGSIKSRMAEFMDEGIQRGDFFPHDKTVAMEIATIVTSDTDQPVEATEDELYARERAAFVRLAKTPETRARIHHMLHVGGVLRN